MPTTLCARTLAAAPADVWRVLDDPHQLPRWWPGVRRIESLDRDRFTQVIYSSRERPVRIDLHVSRREPGRAVSWEQELAGTPFARHLAASVTELRVEPGDGTTVVTVELRQRLRGISRAGGWMLRRANRRRLDEALDGLAAIVG